MFKVSSKFPSTFNYSLETLENWGGRLVDLWDSNVVWTAGRPVQRAAFSTMEP